MPIDLVVVNYHTPIDLDQFLDSLDRHPPSGPATLTVIEVDAPEDYEHKFEWRDNPALTIGVSGNIGYGRACNLGADQGDGEVIALFNADVMVMPGSVERCARALLDHDDWGVVGPKQVDQNGRIRHAGIFGSLAKPVHRGWNEVDRGQYGDTLDAVTVSGSAYFIKRTVWDELTNCERFQQVAPDARGAFLPTPHYYEETWASYHCHAHGRRVLYYGGATIIHKWHRASPLGGWAEQQMPISREMFRAACEHHDIEHD